MIVWLIIDWLMGKRLAETVPHVPRRSAVFGNSVTFYRIQQFLGPAPIDPSSRSWSSSQPKNNTTLFSWGEPWTPPHTLFLAYHASPSSQTNICHAIYNKYTSCNVNPSMTIRYAVYFKTNTTRSLLPNERAIVTHSLLQRTHDTNFSFTERTWRHLLSSWTYVTVTHWKCYTLPHSWSWTLVDRCLLVCLFEHPDFPLLTSTNHSTVRVHLHTVLLGS